MQQTQCWGPTFFSLKAVHTSSHRCSVPLFSSLYLIRLSGSPLHLDASCFVSFPSPLVLMGQFACAALRWTEFLYYLRPFVVGVCFVTLLLRCVLCSHSFLQPTLPSPMPFLLTRILFLLTLWEAQKGFQDVTTVRMTGRHLRIFRSHFRHCFASVSFH